MMLFSERLALSKEFEAWASQNNVKINPLGVISYLCSRRLLISPKETTPTAGSSPKE